MSGAGQTGASVAAEGLRKTFEAPGGGPLHAVDGISLQVCPGELTALVNKDAGVVVDIRPAKDYAAGHIVGAINIPQDKLAARAGELEKHKAKTIILVDALGQTAGTHARELMKSGFTAAKLSGGISSWKGDNLPLVK